MELTGENRNTRAEACPIATLSTTNLTWLSLGSNPCLLKLKTHISLYYN